VIRRESKPGKKGFTLVELLIVIVIIGILAAIAVPKFMGMETRARASTIISDANAIVQAGSMYYASKGEYPGDTYWGHMPDGLEEFIQEDFPFEYPDWEVRYSWDNYHEHTSWIGTWGNGNVVNFSVSSRDLELINAIESVSPGMMEPARSFRGGWYRLIFPVETWAGE